MADLIAAAENVKRFVAQFQGLIDAADALEQIGKLDQVLAERKKAAEAAKTRLDALKGEETKQNEKIDAAIANANDQIKAMLDDAATKAAGVVAEAKTQAEALKAAALVEAIP